MKGLSSGSLVLSFSGTETEIAGSFFTGKTLNEGCAQSRGKLLFSPFFFQITLSHRYLSAKEYTHKAGRPLETCCTQQRGGKLLLEVSPPDPPPHAWEIQGGLRTAPGGMEEGIHSCQS